MDNRGSIWLIVTVFLLVLSGLIEAYHTSFLKKEVKRLEQRIETLEAK